MPPAVYKIFGHIRGTLVPAGQVLVEFECWPLSFGIGAGVAALGIFLATILAVIAFRRRQPRTMAAQVMATVP